MTENAHRGRYHRGYLPHIDRPDLVQSVTYRLADALPKHVVHRIRAEAPPEERRARLERKLDEGLGDCGLREPEAARVVVDNLHHHAKDKYRLLDWVVMPNHVHVLIDQLDAPLDEIVHSWKSYTSKAIQKALPLATTERLWQRGYYDRYIRDEEHLFRVRRYLLLNPVAAGLVDDPEDWPYSSAQNYDDLDHMLETCES